MKEQIRRLRKIAGYTQESLAVACNVERSTVAKWETGKSMPTPSRLQHLAAILHCKIDDLYADTSN